MTLAVRKITTRNKVKGAGVGRLDDLRRSNFQRLVDRYGAASLAKRLGLTGPSYIGQLLSGRRPLSEKTARKFEEKLGLTVRSLDIEGDGGPIPFVGTDNVLLADSIRVLGELIEQEKVRPAPEKFAELVSMVYAQAVQSGRLDHDHARRLVKLIK
jgi:transcriptional regulator with XRE-family HTH domain